MWQAILAIVSVAGVLASGQSGVTKAHRLLDLLRTQSAAPDGTNRLPVAIPRTGEVYCARESNRTRSRRNVSSPP